MERATSEQRIVNTCSICIAHAQLNNGASNHKAGPRQGVVLLVHLRDRAILTSHGPSTLQALSFCEKLHFVA